MTDPQSVFLRILQTLKAKNAPEVARILGLSKQSVYDWQKSIPSLENLTKIAQSGNTSLDWLITGNGEQFFQQPSNEISFEELIEIKVDSVLQDKIKNLRIESLGDVLEPEFYRINVEESEVAKNTREVSGRIRAALIENNIDYSTLPQNFIDDLHNMTQGKVPSTDFLRRASSLTNRRISWFIYGTGDKTFPDSSANFPLFISVTSADQSLAFHFVEAQESIRKNEERKLELEKKNIKRNYLKSLIREEIHTYFNETLNGVVETFVTQKVAEKKLIPSFTIGKKSEDGKENKAA